MNPHLTAAYAALETARWGTLDEQMHAASELLQALRRAKLDEACDEAGVVEVSRGFAE